MGGIGGPELFVVFLVVLLVFGPKRIPEVARGVGKGMRELRRLTTELQREIHVADAEERAKRIEEQRPGAAPRRPGPPSPDPPAQSAAPPAQDGGSDDVPDV